LVFAASSDGRAVTDGRGRKLLVDAAFQDIQSCDAVLVHWFCARREWVSARDAGTREGRKVASESTRPNALVRGSCSGVFLLGEAGLLNERRCTTTWRLHDEMKRRYPKADAAWGAAIIEETAE
jgi:transcriptional regulator GlxA family with amidase domain